MGAVAIYDSQRNDSIQLTNETGSNAALSPASGSQIPGPQGPTGAQGEIGPQGPKGDAGATGATGAAGEKGDKGATGLQGVAGPAGVKGETGATGPAGPAGPVGPAGGSGSGGGSGLEFRDANNVLVANVYNSDPSWLLVGKGNKLFKYLATDVLTFNATPRGISNTIPSYLTPDCTGQVVTPYIWVPSETHSLMQYDSANSWMSYFVNDFVYKSGSKSANASSIYWFESGWNTNPCVQRLASSFYYPLIQMETSELPPAFAGPISISFN